MGSFIKRSKASTIKGLGLPMMGFKIKSPTIEKIIKLKKILRAFFFESLFFWKKIIRPRAIQKIPPLPRLVIKIMTLSRMGEWIDSKNFKN